MISIYKVQGPVRDIIIWHDKFGSTSQTVKKLVQCYMVTKFVVKESLEMRIL